MEVNSNLRQRFCIGTILSCYKCTAAIAVNEVDGSSCNGRVFKLSGDDGCQKYVGFRSASRLALADFLLYVCLEGIALQLFLGSWRNKDDDDDDEMMLVLAFRMGRVLLGFARRKCCSRDAPQFPSVKQ